MSSEDSFDSRIRRSVRERDRRSRSRSRGCRDRSLSLSSGSVNQPRGGSPSLRSRERYSRTGRPRYRSRDRREPTASSALQENLPRALPQEIGEEDEVEMRRHLLNRRNADRGT